MNFDPAPSADSAAIKPRPRKTLVFVPARAFPFTTPRFRFGAEDIRAKDRGRVAHRVHEIVNGVPHAAELIAQIDRHLRYASWLFWGGFYSYYMVYRHLSRSNETLMLLLTYLFMPMLLCLGVAYLMNRDAEKLMAKLAEAYNASLADENAARSADE